MVKLGKLTDGLRLGQHIKGFSYKHKRILLPLSAVSNAQSLGQVAIGYWLVASF